MPLYSKSPKIATYLYRILFCLCCGGIILAGETPVARAEWRVESRHSPRITNLSPLQFQATNHLFLQPAVEMPLDLLTHTLDVHVVTHDDQSLILQIEAAYRLHNLERQGITAILLVVPHQWPGTPQATAVSLTIDAQPLPLQSAGPSMGQSVQVKFNADARRQLVLRYQLHYELPQATFNFHYPISALRSWPTDPNSWRVTIHFAAAELLARPDSWLQVAPSGWTIRAGRLQWLSENRMPREDIRFQGIHPQWMNKIATTQDAIRAQQDPERLHLLGNLYTELYQAPDVDAAARERFYSQALAAYSEALRLGEEQRHPDAFLETVHYGLAALYRLQAITPDGSVDHRYVAMMISEAEQALHSVQNAECKSNCLDSPLSTALSPLQVQELYNWLAQGLRQQLLNARLQEDWPRALMLIDRLSQLPAHVVEQASLEEERLTLFLQEVLQLMQQGNEETALALAAEEILVEDIVTEQRFLGLQDNAADDGGANLLPQPEYRALFANWQITITLTQQSIVVDALAHPLPQRREESRRALENLLHIWQTAGVAGVSLTEETDGFRMRLEQLDARTRLLLVQNTPEMAEWALVRSVFLAAEADIEQEAYLLWQRTTQAIDVNFRPVGDQWYSIAAALEREAAKPVTSDQQATDRSPLVTAVRSAQHRLEASRWQQLVSDSSVQVVIQESPAASGPLRVWLLGLTDTPQRLSAQFEHLSTVRLLLASALGILLISLLAGALWLLL